MNLRRLSFGLATLLGSRPRGWFIPYRYADTLPAPGERGRYPALEPLFEAARPRFAALLDEAEILGRDLASIGADAPPEPRWNQDWFPRLDAVALYTLIRTRRPARIVEVGSGHSTRFMARAVRDGGLTTAITAIDPAPRAAIEGLGVTFSKRTLHAAGLSPFRALQPGDMLFIDSSHILMPGSDVDLLFGDILPALPPGVIVHVHDVFLPDDYPLEWGWRGYNEQQGLFGFLQSGYRLDFASQYVATRMPEAIGPVVAKLPLVSGAFETSLWMTRV